MSNQMSTRAEEINAIAKLAKDGDAETLHALWDGIEKLSIWYCRRTFNKLSPSVLLAAGVEVDDLIQCGYFAMLSALDTFDPESGGNFANWYKFYLLRELNICTGNRTQRQQMDPLRRTNTTRLETPIDSGDGSSTEFGDLIPDESSEAPFLAVEEDVFNKQLHDELDRAMNVLTSREKAVLEKHYYHDQSYKQIAASLGLSIERVRMIKSKSLGRLCGSRSARSLHRFIDDCTDFYRRGADPVAANVIWREELADRLSRTHPPYPLSKN